MDLGHCISDRRFWRKAERERHRGELLGAGGSCLLPAGVVDCLIAFELRIQTDIFENRKFAQPRLDERCVAVQIFEITGLHPVPVNKTLMDEVSEQQAAEVISAG